MANKPYMPFKYLHLSECNIIKYTLTACSRPVQCMHCNILPIACCRLLSEYTPFLSLRFKPLSGQGHRASPWSGTPACVVHQCDVTVLHPLACPSSGRWLQTSHIPGSADGAICLICLTAEIHVTTKGNKKWFRKPLSVVHWQPPWFAYETIKCNQQITISNTSRYMARQ